LEDCNGKKNLLKVARLERRWREKTIIIDRRQANRKNLYCIGILRSLLGMRLSEVMLNGDYIYKGILTESYVAGQFKAAGIPLYYWRDENMAEVDFLLDTPDGIAPAEVKSGDNKRSASMELFRKQFSPEKLYRISANNFGATQGLFSVPLYAAHLLAECNV